MVSFLKQKVFRFYFRFLISVKHFNKFSNKCINTFYSQIIIDLLFEKMFWQSALKAVSLGTVDFTTGHMIIKDPFTGVGNIMKEAKDAICHDFDKGVWIGKRALDS